MQLVAIILFILTYVLMLSIPKYKHYIAFGTALIFVIFGILPIGKVLGEIDFNVLFMIIGTMGTVSLFIESKMPALLSDIIISKVPNTKWMVVALSVFAGIVSAFVDNVATVLMIVPITLIVAKKLKVSPVPIVISVAIFSNIEGAATLVGDTTSILLAGHAGMNFNDFFFLDGKIGLFFITQAGMIASAIMLLILMRKFNKKIDTDNRTKVTNYYSSVLLVGTIVALILASFIPNKPELTNAFICMLFFIVGILIKLFKERNFDGIKDTLKEIDMSTILLLASLFVIVGGIKETGVINKISDFIVSIGGNNEFLIFTLIFVISVLVSAFIDNIPYVATMLPVISSLTVATGINPYLLYYSLIIGATLGGNFTPIGASANIAALGILKKNGYEVKLKEYLKYSIPLTLAASITGYVLTLLVLG